MRSDKDPDKWVDENGMLRSVRKDALVTRLFHLLGQHDQQSHGSWAESSDVADVTPARSGPPRILTPAVIDENDRTRAYIPLRAAGGAKALIDSADIHAYSPIPGVKGRVSDYGWELDRRGYPSAKVEVGYEDGKIIRKNMSLHQFLTGEKYPDHINANDIPEAENRLDNRRANLRPTPGDTKGKKMSKNASNVPKRSSNTSGIKGVTYNKSAGKWVAQIEWRDHETGKRMVKRKSFPGTEEGKAAAAEYRKKLAEEIQGEYAYENRLSQKGE